MTFEAYILIIRGTLSHINGEDLYNEEEINKSLNMVLTNLYSDAYIDGQESVLRVVEKQSKQGG